GRGRKAINRPPSTSCSRELGIEGVLDMLNTRSRKLTVVLAAGAMTLFDTAGAFADDGGGGGGGGTNPLCSGTPLSATPFCAPPSQQPPGDGGGGGGGSGGGSGGGGSSPSARPADGGGGG